MRRLCLCLFVPVIWFACFTSSLSAFEQSDVNYSEQSNPFAEFGIDAEAWIYLSRRIGPNGYGSLSAVCRGDNFLFYINIMGDGVAMDTINIGPGGAPIEVEFFVDGKSYISDLVVSPSGLSVDLTGSDIQAVFFDTMFSYGDIYPVPEPHAVNDMQIAFQLELSNGDKFTQALAVNSDGRLSFVKVGQACGIVPTI